MTSSRRGFLQSLGAGAALGATMQWPLAEVARAARFEPPRVNQNDGLIRLDSNENAYGPSPKVAEAIRSSVGQSNRYPWLEYGSLIEQIATLHHVKPEQILLGCGSTEILRMAACAFLGSGKQLIHAAPTFETMEFYARATGADVLAIPLAPDFSHNLGAMLARTTAATGLIYVCNPNNPTASLTPRKDLEAFIAKLPASTLILIDEAYHHFALQSHTYVSFIDRPIADERVIVARTFSKVYGLAGLRLGYAVASPQVVQQMRKFSTADSVNAIVTQAAQAALSDTEGLKVAIERNFNDRQEFFNQAMARMVKPIDSHANFVMTNVQHPAEPVIEHFRKHGVLIGRAFPPMDTYIRVSLGLPDEMLAFWRAWDALPFAKEFMQH
jgi:histidinol-phosphate aminotransferase